MFKFITSCVFVLNSTEIHDDKVEEKLMKLKDNFTSLSETFSDKTNWECLSKNLSSFTKLYNVKEITSFRTHDSLSVTSQIISSIESDRFGSHFATAGILKQISLFNLDKMIEKPTFHDYPDLSIKCNSKISCLSWNSFNESELCSADYDGVVNLYDTVSGKLMISWTEHEKRCWSVDTSAVDPHKIISGSDDCKIKLWSKQSSKSLLTLDIRANVCTVRFSPKDSNLIAVGGADHRVFLFDLRKPSVPIFNEKKHSKSVSYVRFNNSGSSIISASTDSTLKLWSCCQDQNTWQLDKTFRGHLNEKNFVGLALLDGGLAATGSEDNCVVIYDQNLEYPVLKYSMKTTCPLTGIQMDDEMGTFVSSLSWANRPDKEGNPILLSANSTGNVSISSIIEE